MAAEGAECPAAVVRSYAPRRRLPAGSIVVEVNDWEENHDVLAAAVAEAQLRGRPILAVGVCPPETGMSARQEKVLRDAGHDVPEQKRILELNAEHAVVKKLQGLEDDGRFEIVLAPERPPGLAPGANWLRTATEPDLGLLIVRQTFLDRSSEEPATVRIARVDGGATCPAPGYCVWASVSLSTPATLNASAGATASESAARQATTTSRTASNERVTRIEKQHAAKWRHVMFSSRSRSA